MGFNSEFRGLKTLSTDDCGGLLLHIPICNIVILLFIVTSFMFFAGPSDRVVEDGLRPLAC